MDGVPEIVVRLRALRAHLEDQPLTRADGQDLETIAEAADHLDMVDAEQRRARINIANYEESAARWAARAEAAEAKVAELTNALLPFDHAVYNDNGDVTIDTSHIETRDWLRVRSILAGEETARGPSLTQGNEP